MSPLHAALATKLIEWAGLADRVTVVIGESGKVIPMLRKRCVQIRIEADGGLGVRMD